MDNLRFDVDSAGIASLVWDMRGASKNVLNELSLEEFAMCVTRALEDDAVRGVIITSAKDDFIAGADLNMLRDAAGRPAEALYRRNLAFKDVLRRIETSGKPFVAALNGTALGGGYEIALACHRRIAADRPHARIGLPEVRLGLLPGGGGTQRLPRLLGIREALPLLTEGKTLDPRRAHQNGLVDEVVAPEALHEAACTWIEHAREPKQPWDEPKFRVPGGEIQSPRGYETFMAANALLRKATWGNYPAPQAILACVYHGLQMPLDRGLEYEARRFVELCRGTVAQNMMRSLFFGLNEANKLKRRPDGVPKATFQTVGVLGAGMMGAGIAYQCALRGLKVILLERDEGRAAQGKAYAEGLVQARLKKGRMDEGEAVALLDRIDATTSFDKLSEAEMVIEAVFEDRAVKAEVTRKAEAAMPKRAIFASNTSTLPITGLAQASVNPEAFIGLHFFSPVEKMPLVEVIVGAKTTEETLARSMDFVRVLGKTPIVVRDSRGFFTSRVFGTYVGEGVALLLEGVEPALIENAGRIAGMPVGPLALADEVSLELMVKVQKQTAEDLGDDYVSPPSAPVLSKMVGDLKRMGKKCREGFYDYPEGRPKHLWRGLRELFPVAPEQPRAEDVAQRLLAVQALETLRCLDEGVLQHPADADVGSILGWGFCPFYGGVLSYVDTVGAETLVRRCDALAQVHGERFRVPERLRRLAADGGRIVPL